MNVGETIRVVPPFLTKLLFSEESCLNLFFDKESGRASSSTKSSCSLLHNHLKTLISPASKSAGCFRRVSQRKGDVKDDMRSRFRGSFRVALIFKDKQRHLTYEYDQPFWRKWSSSLVPPLSAKNDLWEITTKCTSCRHTAFILTKIRSLKPSLQVLSGSPESGSKTELHLWTHLAVCKVKELYWYDPHWSSPSLPNFSLQSLRLTPQERFRMTNIGETGCFSERPITPCSKRTLGGWVWSREWGSKETFRFCGHLCVSVLRHRSIAVGSSCFSLFNNWYLPELVT